ncbi:S8 family peptidase [Salininema proteolyticum]|uniref:S8 family serine peptidase n=1 Tax=Salininema proteolyticum TaxID=1607685 RepID=A0ABV8U0E8_9ACTN
MLAAAGAASVAAAFTIPFASTAFAQGGEAEILASDSPDAVSGEYIAVFTDTAAPHGKKATAKAADGIAESHSAELGSVYHSTLNGFSFAGSADEAEEIASRTDIAYVEAVQTMGVSDIAQNDPPNWGTDRLDQQDLPLDDAYATPDSQGSGATVYVLDTGINPDHQEFGGRASMGPSFAGENDSTDCHGHGTHVAGSVAGAEYGVAPQADVVGVQVLGCDGYGSTEGIISAIDWVASSGSRPAVINMSLGGASDGTDQAYYDAVQNAVDQGVAVVAAAGNDGDDACNYAPARFDNVLTVANATRDDARYTGRGTSNYGTCVDVFGPGTDILSARHDSNTDVVAFTGTSMASPHLAGVAALYLADNPGATPNQVTQQILGNATADTLTDVGAGSPNLNANTEFMLDGSDGGDPTDPDPVDPSDCDGHAATESGSLSGSGSTSVHPDSGYYYSGAGTHSGCLSGPSDADFDLYLQRWNGSSWSSVASGTSASSEETVSYDGTAGYYRWVAYSYSGSGSYTIGSTQP